MKHQTHQLPGFLLTDHTFTVPLDHDHPDGETLEVFAREAVALGRDSKELPWLVFFQGGPGFESPRPFGKSGWLKRALESYRVLLLDQRGTGRSSPVNRQTLARHPSAQAQADYLKHFRADAIVKDAEWIRRDLVGPDQPWSALGQSYGGFCITHYLSAAPQGLREAFLTGGLPPLERPTDDVYRATYRRVIQKNERYYERYPGDVESVREIVAHLDANEVSLPSGDPLTPRRFQQLGIAFGADDGFERVHYLLEQAFVEGRLGREMNHGFLRKFEAFFAFQTNPIYALLHEAIYCQGTASRWSAHRLREEYPEFEPHADLDRVLFTGEMIYPWMFDDYAELQPLKQTAHILAAYEDWPELYDPAVLRANTVPCAAAVYYNDMYVELAFSEESARDIQGIKLWITNEYEHNGLRADGERVLERLIDMARGEIG